MSAIVSALTRQRSVNHGSTVSEYAPLVLAALALVLPTVYTMGIFRKSWSAEGKHVFITGGSQGLGLALAKLVASKGADVTICARDTGKLQKALEEIKSSARDASTQTLAHISADVSSFDDAAAALATASGTSAEASNTSGPSSSKSQTQQVGRVPDIVFCCAGASKPGFFLEQTQDDFESGFRTIYMTALATAHAAANLFVRSGKREAKIILTGSTLSLMGLVGYAQYAPMKFAIRGLAECLRSELQLYPGLSVHAYFPGTILSPGFEQENKTKPQITKDLEGGEADGLTPEACAKGLLEGIELNRFFITTDFQTELFRAATASGGSTPGNSWLLERLLAFIALIGLPIWRMFEADSKIKKHSKEHLKSLGAPQRS